MEAISDRLYIALEHIASEEPGMNTLDGYLRNRPPDLAQSLRWAIQFCHGMEYAYSKGVKAHRDIKPANIMIDQNMAVKITDFGLAGVYAEKMTAQQYRAPNNIENISIMQTVIGTSMGTPEYMSPEQFDNLTTCDERSDIYSFGIVLYRMAASGNLPFKADNSVYRWAAMKHYHQETSVPRLTAPMSSIIYRCLEKKPDDRYQKFRELRVDLESLYKQTNGEIIKQPELEDLEVSELNNKGYSFASLGKNQEAIVWYDRVLEIAPRTKETWVNKGKSLASLGKEQEAIGCFERAIEIDPKYATAWSNKGALLVSIGKVQEAIACYDRALEINPKYSMVWHRKGNILVALSSGDLTKPSIF